MELSVCPVNFLRETVDTDLWFIKKFINNDYFYVVKKILQAEKLCDIVCKSQKAAVLVNANLGSVERRGELASSTGTST